MTTLIVMAKAPVAGQVKTRLIPALSAQQAADLAGQLLCQTLQLVEQLDRVRCLVAVSPADQLEQVKRLSGTQLPVMAQPEGDLGERLSELFQSSFSQGADGVMALGTDHPGLPLAYLQEAVEVLEAKEKEVVLGPTEDGGYYLVGLTQPEPKLFEGIPWSTGQVFKKTLEQAEALGLKVKKLPSWFDLDRPEDLKRLESIPKEFKQRSG